MYFKKALEVLNACKESIMAIEIQPHIEVTDGDDYGVEENDACGCYENEIERG
jgi:hypothetical protein